MAKPVGRKPFVAPEEGQGGRVCPASGRQAETRRDRLVLAKATGATLPKGPTAPAGRAVGAEHEVGGPADVAARPHRCGADAARRRGGDLRAGTAGAPVAPVRQSQPTPPVGHRSLRRREGTARARPALPERRVATQPPARSDAAERRRAGVRRHPPNQRRPSRRGAGRRSPHSSEMSADDHVQFMLAIVQLNRGEPDEALRHLVRAVELNPENRRRAAGCRAGAASRASRVPHGNRTGRAAAAGEPRGVALIVPSPARLSRAATDDPIQRVTAVPLRPGVPMDTRHCSNASRPPASPSSIPRRPTSNPAWPSARARCSGPASTSRARRRSDVIARSTRVCASSIR